MRKAVPKATTPPVTKADDALVMPPSDVRVPRDALAGETISDSLRGAGPRGEWDPLRKYIQEAVITPLLTREEELSLAAKVQQGDDQARERMILSNLRLVLKIAKEYEGCGLPMLDLVNLGNIGLMKAVDKFKPDKGAKFSTYGVWWIKQSILRGLTDQTRTIRLPAHASQEITRLKRTRDELEVTFGREPTAREIAHEAQVPESRVRKLLAVSATTIALDAPISANNEDSVSTTIADDESKIPSVEAERNELKSRVVLFLKHLNPRERTILTRRFGLNGKDPETLETIGHDYGVTRERIRQVEAKALRALRKLASGEEGSAAA